MSIEHRWQDQTAIITGGAAGLGFALAARLAEQGVSVAIFDRREEALETARTRLGTKCRTYRVDVASVESVHAAVAQVLAATGRIDILVNCAGITGVTNIKSHEVHLED